MLEAVAEYCINDLVVPRRNRTMCSGSENRIPISFEEGMLKQSWKFQLKDRAQIERSGYELTTFCGGLRYPRHRKPAAVAARGQSTSESPDLDENKVPSPSLEPQV